MTDRLHEISFSHPRLLFDASGLAGLRERANSTHARYAELLFAWVRKNAGWSPPAHLPDEALTEVILEECGAFVTNAALAYAVGGDPEHRELARRWALAMCELPRGDFQNYGLGLYAAGLARAYDWLYEEWSDSERRQIRAHLARLVKDLYDGSFPGTPKAHWWADAHLHHDFWVPVAGFGEAALALLGEVEGAQEWSRRAWEEMRNCLSWLGEDGAWHEGAADWCYTLAPLLWFYGAWQSVTGEDPHDLPWLRNTARFRLYHRLPDGSYIYLNDSFRSGRYNTSGSASCHLLRRLASLYQDGQAQWLADQDEPFDLAVGPKGVYQAPYEGSAYTAERREYPHSASQCAAWNLLWYDPDVPAVPPDDLPRLHRFENADLAVLRTGWDAEAAVVSFTCGPLAGHRCAERVRAGEKRSPSNFSHAHADYNSLTLFARGQYFLIPPGYARRSSHFQNTVAVNGADFRVDPGLELRLLGVTTGPEFSAAVGDATAGFPSELQVRRYRRYLVLLEDCLVLFDDLRLAGPGDRQWKQFEWRLHSDPATHQVELQGAGAIWRPHGSAGPQLTLTVLQPAEFAWERSTLSSISGDPLLDAVRLVRPEWSSDRMQVLTVLSWADQPEPMELAEGEGWIGVRWPGQIARPVIAFAPDPGQVIPDREAASGGMLLFGADASAPAVPVHYPA